MKNAIVQNEFGAFLHQNEDVWVKEYPDAGHFTWAKAIKIAHELGATAKAIKHYGYEDAIIYTADRGPRLLALAKGLTNRKPLLYSRHHT